MMTTQDANVVQPFFTKVNWREFACGWGAAFINITVTYPVNKIIFRQVQVYFFCKFKTNMIHFKMLHGVKVHNAFEQLHIEGLHYLYRGILPPLFQKTFSIAIMFGVYDEVRRPLIDKGVNQYVAKTVGGLVSGTTEAILVPFERIQTLLQDSAYHKKFRNTYHAFKVLGFSYGFREYYRGLVPILLRNGPSNVCFFIIRDEVQLRLPHSENAIKKTINQFICGSLIGVLLSSLFFPLNVVKVTMQSRLGNEFQNFFEVFKQIYRERGSKMRCMYHGVQTNAARAFISWGVMNAAYEHIKKIVY